MITCRLSPVSCTRALIVFFSGAAVYSCSPFFLKSVITFWPRGLSAQLVKACAAAGACVPISRCAGFSSASSSLSEAAL